MPRGQREEQQAQSSELGALQPQVDLRALTQLLDMGYNNQQAEHALSMFDNDVERAADWLLDQPSTCNAPLPPQLPASAPRLTGNGADFDCTPAPTVPSFPEQASALVEQAHLEGAPLTWSDQVVPPAAADRSPDAAVRAREPPVAGSAAGGSAGGSGGECAGACFFLSVNLW